MKVVEQINLNTLTQKDNPSHYLSLLVLFLCQDILMKLSEIVFLYLTDQSVLFVYVAMEGLLRMEATIESPF